MVHSRQEIMYWFLYHPRHVLTQNTAFFKRFKMPDREGDKKGVKIKDKGERKAQKAIQSKLHGEDEIHDARQQAVDDHIQEENNAKENGQEPTFSDKDN